MTVFIIKGAFQEIERHVLSAYPEEGCGVLIGEVPAKRNRDSEYDGVSERATLSP